nr:MAG TPA: hypothetical protein [Caudoviricetes sp.]
MEQGACSYIFDKCRSVPGCHSGLIINLSYQPSIKEEI